MKLTIPCILLIFTVLVWALILKNEFGYVLVWWAVIFLLGLMAFPLSATVFSSFTDKGYLMSKGLGIAISSYALWLLSMTKLVKINGFGCWSVVIGCGVIIYLLLFKKARLSLINFKQSDVLPWIFIGESIFLFSLSFWTYLRGFNARIEGLE